MGPEEHEGVNKKYNPEKKVGSKAMGLRQWQVVQGCGCGVAIRIPSSLVAIFHQAMMVWNLCFEGMKGSINVKFTHVEEVFMKE